MKRSSENGEKPVDLGEKTVRMKKEENFARTDEHVCE